MRVRPLALFAFLVAVSALAQTEKAYTVEARGQKYSIAVDVHPLVGGQAQYDVRVTDLSTNAVVWHPQLHGENSFGSPLDSAVEKDGMLFSVSVRKYPNALTADLVVEGQGAVIDSLRSGWRGPFHERQMNVSGAYRVGGKVTAPVIMKRVEPLYPEAARKDRVAGIVILEACIDKAGAVRDVMVLKEIREGLSEATVDAVKHWRFEPATMNGEPVDVIFNLTVNFKLSKPVSQQRQLPIIIARHA
jgi:TonB family protein